MPSFEHGKRSPKIHTVFQDTTETWLDRPRQADFDGVLVRRSRERVDSQADQTLPLVLPNADESCPSRNEPETTDRDRSVMADRVAAVPSGSRKSRKAPAVQKGLDQRLVTAHHPISALAEQYRKLYIEIVRAGRTRELRTLMIASALPDEGKTFSAVNLALTMAESGSQQSVLLVDADFRKPSVHKLLGTSSEYGLVDYLLGEVPYAQIFASTKVPGLTVVYAGHEVENPTALLSPEKIGQFFQDIKEQNKYGYIILDTSPILLTSEPAALVQYVDAALLVVRAGHTPRHTVTHAIETLGRDNILGCVFNGVTATDSYYYRHEYAGYYQQPQS